LRYLLGLVDDPSPEIQKYFHVTVVPNPFDSCFVAFGSMAVEPLLKHVHLQGGFAKQALRNLAAIKNPIGNRPALTRALDDAVALSERCTLVELLGRNGVSEIATRLVCEYNAGCPALRVSDEHYRFRIDDGVAIATRFCEDKAATRAVLEELLSHTNHYVVIHAIQAAGELGVYSLYDQMTRLFDNGATSQVRAQAAVALARRDALGREAILGRLEYAEPQIELPLLSLALSYFDDRSAIPGLIKGMQDSFADGNDEWHENFASALARLSADEARRAYAKWYRRM
jgi:hypothetical protein